MAQMAGPSHPEVKAFADQGGFDPMHDLDEILITAPAKQNPNALFLMRGKFDVAKLSQLAAMGGMKGADYHGVQILVRAGQQGGFSAVAVDGVYSGKLDNAGETVTLAYSSGVKLLSVTYQNAAPWPATAAYSASGTVLRSG